MHIISVVGDYRQRCKFTLATKNGWPTLKLLVVCGQTHDVVGKSVGKSGNSLGGP